jgi:hypothetical protein
MSNVFLKGMIIIKGDNNKIRHHSSLGCLIPEKFRLIFEKKGKKINTLKSSLKK